MYGWICEEPAGIGALQWREVPTPVPAAGEVRVAVRAASLNFPDLLIVQGRYQAKPTPPFVPGVEFAGIVEAVGPGVQDIATGAHVLTVGIQGGFGTHACVAAPALRVIPAAMPFEDAACFMMAYGTAYHALVDRAGLRPGEVVLVLGAAGGVGSAAVQVAKAAGARVIAGVSSDEKAALCRRIGADETINYSTAKLRDALKSLTGGRGPAVIYDPVGGALAEPAFRSIAWRGRYVVIGFAEGAIPSLPFNLPLLKGASIVGAYWGEFVRHEPAASARAIGELLEWYRDGRIKPVIDQVLPMQRLPEAFARMSSRQALGKLVLVNSP